ncbi:MAG: molecular chaperone HtpG [[Eubacterium] sulci]|jgi:chaperone protein htpG|nr:molecular chaperone HtpG [[Eubacterium] sulci]MBF1160614.1 molecular chaperone HtpG [[Eubacterium] sulci]MBF1171044.1 molecular chaperone HtpG [[Eubacterium] sulci]MBF1175265.1 molecular chaperone HtpG [[Eubacterium] sulci]
MAKKQFKAESKKLLDLMIHSIYTNKEIFLRELISNSSDALDKLYYKSLTSGELGIKRSDFYIQITPDKELRTLTIRDNGIGMSKDELENNLGTIAKSGSLGFKEEQEKNKDENTKAKNIDIIGQFGVGFYSAFMVSDIVSVTSKAFGSDEAYRWVSRGADGYTIEEASLDGHGTEIVLTIKEDTDGENYSSFLEDYTIRNLIKKYSDYIRYPIRMMVEKSRPVGETEEGKAPEFEKYNELETLNSMEPIWKRQKSKVKPEEYNDYYKSKYMDYMDPARVIRTNVEGVSSFTALMFIPGHAPFDYYTKEYEKGLQLYSSGVMIMDKCKDLLPDYFNFVKGLVDSQDLSLNISREMLQQDRQLKNIAKNVEKKIKRDLEDFLKNDRDGYEKFFENFGKQLKYGLYESYGMNREVLEDLVLFYSSTEQKNVTLAEYLERMKDDQNAIYYAAGESIKKIDLLPQTEFVKSKGYEILYLTDEMDEFVFNILGQYKDKPFKSVSAEDIAEDDTEEAKENMKKLEEDNKELLEDIKNALGDKVSEVKLSPRLKSSAVCLTTKGDISLEMEKILSAMPMDQGIKAERVLELNPEHSVFEALNKIKSDDADGKKLEVYANLLYDQALLISGLQIDDPVEFSKSICQLIVDAN